MYFNKIKKWLSTIYRWLLNNGKFAWYIGVGILYIVLAVVLGTIGYIYYIMIIRVVGYLCQTAWVAQYVYCRVILLVVAGVLYLKFRDKYLKNVPNCNKKVLCCGFDPSELDGIFGTFFLFCTYIAIYNTGVYGAVFPYIVECVRTYIWDFTTLYDARLWGLYVSKLSRTLAEMVALGNGEHAQVVSWLSRFAECLWDMGIDLPTVKPGDVGEYISKMCRCWKYSSRLQVLLEEIDNSEILQDFVARKGMRVGTLHDTVIEIREYYTRVRYNWRSMLFERD